MLIVRRLIKPLLLALAFLLSIPSVAQAACGEGQIDLLEYWMPKGNTSYNMLYCTTWPGLPASGQTVGGTQRMPDALWQQYRAQGAPGDGAFMLDGGTDTNGNPQYFVYSYDANNIYFLEDQVWGGQSCTDGGGPAFYRVMNASNGSWGSPYPRCVTPGETFSTNEQAVAYSKASYSEGFKTALTGGALPRPVACENPLAGASTPSKAVELVDNIGSSEAGVQCLDEPSIAFKAVGGSGSGETMYFTKGFGMTAFVAKEGSATTFHSAYHDPSCAFPPDLSCSEDETGKAPLFIYPQNNNPTDWNKYLANSQVYCAPGQVNWPKLEGTSPNLQNCTPAGTSEIDPLGQGVVNSDSTACEPQEYPAVDFVESYNLQNFTLPLFRNQSGGISIESDLSRVNPEDTLAQAMKRNARPDYAPQFFLSSPQMQCLNAVRYVNYVNDLCAEYGPESEECSAKKVVNLPGGGFRNWEAVTALLTEDKCLNFTPEMEQNTDVAQIVRSLQTYTPSAYKMGFLVQHNYLFDGGANSLLGRGQYLVKSIAAWLKGDTQPDPRIKEHLVVVPVWYQSGITTNEYNRDQIAPYPIDPETVDLENVKVSEDNFKGPFWQTYAPVLPLNIQEAIFKTKAKTVKENYELLIERVRRTDPNDVLPCEGDECIRIDTEYLEELKQSFPASFFKDQSNEQVYGFLVALQRSIVARINSGIQATQPYIPLDERPDDYDEPPGPLSVRSFNRCVVDPKNILLGESETASDINYQALQPLANEDEDPALVAKAIDAIRNEFRAKILWQDPDLEHQFPKSYSYIILPDESIDIDIAQAYVTPMFLSPQMYDSIMSGENPLYPWKTDGGVDGGMGGAGSGDSADYLSAFLRTSGYDRQYSSEERGYVKMERIITQYGSTCTTAPPGGAISIDPTEPVCTCNMERVGDPIIEDMGWEEYPSIHDSEEPTITNGCRKVEYIQKEKSTVKAIDHLPEDNPDSNLQVPGKTMALHEYLRRMAFTPHYLIQKYEGLEQFYQNGVPIPEFLKKSLDKLSGYFAQLQNMSSTYGEANSAGTCGTVYVNRSKAQQYADEIRQLMSAEMKADMLTQYPRAQLYGECGGQDCVEFILNTVLEYPICNGDRYVNPYMAIAIGMTETGGLQGIGENNTGFHFGCSPIAFSAYKPGATHNGLQCVVENATPNQVINPLLVWNEDVLNSCVDVSGGAVPTHGTVRREQTVEDGLACMVATFHRYCQSIEGDNIDVYAIQGDPNVAEDMYGYGSFPGPLVSRFNELIVLAQRSGTMTPALEARIKTSITEMTSGCTN